MNSSSMPVRTAGRPGKSLRLTLGFWFVCIALTSGVGIGVLTYVLRSRGLQGMAAGELIMLRDDRIRDVEQWYEERRISLTMWATAPSLVSLCEEHRSGKPLSEVESRRQLLDRIRLSYRCHSVEIMDPTDGRSVLGSTRTDTAQHQLPDAVVEAARGDDRVTHTQVRLCPEHKLTTMIMACPVRSGRERQIVGILAYYLDLTAHFYPEVLRTAGLGQTGEILLVHRDGLAQSPLRHIGNAVARVTLDAEPDRLARRGLTGLLTSSDYAGHTVLAAHGFLPALDWGIVVKQDQHEILAPVREMARHVVLVTGCGMLVAMLLGGLIARHVAAPAEAIARTTERITAGDLSVRADPAGPREISTVARNLNLMVDRLAGQLHASEALNVVYAAAGAHTLLDHLVAETLPAVMETTRSQVGVFYLADSPGQAFRRIAAHGFPGESLPAEIHAGPPDHYLTACVAGRQVQVLSGLDDRLDLHIPTQSGTARPAALMSIPLVHSGQVIAVVGLASVHVYREEDIEIGRTLSISLAQSVAACLANARNLQLTEELQAKNEELTSANEELQSQAEELQQQAEELEEQRAAVKEADRLKSQFLSNMSHELRTPLNSIMALSQLMIARGTGRNPRQENEYLGIIERNGRHLLNLINDILDLSKIEAGRLDLSCETFRADEVLERALDTIRPLAQARGLAITTEIGEAPLITSDADKLHQVLLNLLSNAVKFTDRGGITVRVLADARQVSFVVQDTGIGIAEADLPLIFDEFRQVDGSTTRRHEGTGLGLAIGRKLARLLGGDIAATSRPGQGSTFTLAVPLRGPAAPRGEPAPPGTRPRPAAAPPAGKTRTVLVVDDDPGARALLQGHLAQAGYEVVLAPNGRQALEMARAVQPYAMTLDVLMPDVDGWEVIRELKSCRETAGIPILVISITDGLGTAVALGASGFLAKPVDRGLLLAELQRVAGRSSLQRILVIDDDERTRQHLSQLLSERFAEVRTAAGGREGLQAALQRPPDAIILDLVMPDMDGFAVLEELRSDPAGRSIPVLILTAKDLTAEEERRLRASVGRILGKAGMSREQLLRELERNLARLAPAPGWPATSDEFVLVVDDDEIAAMQISMALEDAGYRVAVARNGEEALSRIREEAPGAVVLDLMMPGMDGFEVLEQIRQLAETGSVPVLVLTAKELSGQDRARLNRGHVRQLIQKGSVDRDELVAAVRGLLVKPAAGAGASASRTATAAPAAAGPGSSHSGPILVVEDDPDNRLTIGAILDDLGRRHVHAADGDQAVRMAAELGPALILMDVQLPGVSGVEAARAILSEPRTAGIPILALTDEAMPGDRERLLAAGFREYLAKPMNRDELARVLDRWLGSRGGKPGCSLDDGQPG